MVSRRKFSSAITVTTGLHQRRGHRHTVFMHHSADSGKLTRQQNTQVKQISAFLMERYGPLLGREDLIKVLGFPSSVAFDRYVQRGHLALKLVRQPNRRGVFALAPEVARYLVEISRGGDIPESESEERVDVV